ncbi:MAG: hypothetical protein ACMXYE_00675 [Candidatus Woesearchaeota archaeon]
MANDEATYYVSIQNPRDFRKDLLGTSKIMIQLLQRNTRLHEIREAKIEKMYAFSKVMGEVNMLSSKLRKVLPKTKASSMPKTTTPAITHQESAPVKPVRRDHHEHHDPNLGKLQRDLEDIERKLSMLE